MVDSWIRAWEGDAQGGAITTSSETEANQVGES
jgi:hypothetical protein